VHGVWPTALSCWLLVPSTTVAEWGQSLGYGRVAYGFSWDFAALELVEVSSLSLVSHCWGRELSYGLSFSGPFFLFVVFRPVRSFVVSTHSTWHLGVGQGQRVLA